MAQGNVENWLGALLNEALHSVHLVIKNAHVAVDDPNLDLIEFLNSFPAQVSQFLGLGLLMDNNLSYGYVLLFLEIWPIYILCCTIYKFTDWYIQSILCNT